MTSIVRVLLNLNPSKTYWFDLQDMYDSFQEERSDWIKKTSGKAKDETRNDGQWIRADLAIEGKEQRYVMVVSRCMCKRLCTGGIPLLKHLL